MKIFFDALSRIPTISIGTQAFIISGLQILNRKFPGCEIILLSSSPEIEESYLCKLQIKLKIVQREKSQISTIFQIRKIVKEVDVVVSSWGDAYISCPPHTILKKTLLLKRKDTPLVLFTSSIGPFYGGVKQLMAKYGLAKFDYLSVRDVVTFQYFRQIGINNVELINDTAFVLKPAGEKEIDIIFQNSSIPFTDSFIGLNISILLYHRFSSLSRNYISEMIDLIDWLRTTYKRPIVLIPHQIFPECYKYDDPEYKSVDGDDRYVIELIWQQLKNKEGLYKLSGQYSAMELKGVIKRCEIFIGGRMHSVIGAVSQSIPSIILQYSHKAEGMMKLLELSEYSWDIKNDNEELIYKIGLLWKNKDSIKRNLQNKIPRILDEINSITDKIEYLLKK